MQLTRIELPNERELAAIKMNERLPERPPAPVQSVDGARLRGMLQSVLRRGDGTVLYAAEENLITNAGFDLLCNVLGLNSQPSDLTHIAIGTGSTAAAAAQTALVTQVARESATYAHTTGSKSFTMEATFSAGTGTGAITESGLFNASSGGTMFNRVTFAAINKGGNDSLEQTFTITFS